MTLTEMIRIKPTKEQKMNIYRANNASNTIRQDYLRKNADAYKNKKGFIFAAEYMINNIDYNSDEVKDLIPKPNVALGALNDNDSRLMDCIIKPTIETVLEECESSAIRSAYREQFDDDDIDRTPHAFTFTGNSFSVYEDRISFYGLGDIRVCDKFKPDKYDTIFAVYIMRDTNSMNKYYAIIEYAQSSILHYTDTIYSSTKSIYCVSPASYEYNSIVKIKSIHGLGKISFIDDIHVYADILRVLNLHKALKSITYPEGINTDEIIKIDTKIKNIEHLIDDVVFDTGKRAAMDFMYHKLPAGFIIEDLNGSYNRHSYEYRYLKFIEGFIDALRQMTKITNNNQNTGKFVYVEKILTPIDLLSIADIANIYTNIAESNKSKIMRRISSFEYMGSGLDDSSDSDEK